jgi:ribosomal protein L36
MLKRGLTRINTNFANFIRLPKADGEYPSFLHRKKIIRVICVNLCPIKNMLKRGLTRINTNFANFIRLPKADREYPSFLHRKKIIRVICVNLCPIKNTLIWGLARIPRIPLLSQKKQFVKLA